METLHLVSETFVFAIHTSIADRAIFMKQLYCGATMLRWHIPVCSLWTETMQLSS